MCKEKRKIVLFIDNCTAHSLIPEMNAVKVAFLPPNTTSKLQPLDQGIIRSCEVFLQEVTRKEETQQCEEWEKVSKISNLSTTTTFENFTVFDSEVQVCGLWTDDEIVPHTISSPPSDEEEMDVPTKPNITAAEAKDAVHILRSFMECSENVGKRGLRSYFSD
ncbi:hypothetical protein AVEN_270265-1 [Araneus ventricosus]|uniref:DDE-1 domain-containing protein n=1 Tax=Araneus ventricosus TaxID=182803 RepID=A0A4Y2W6B6_ARAVE|nr:hypothetical protein AVEN_270265-1 [Araneus ventricosus]